MELEIVLAYDRADEVCELFAEYMDLSIYMKFDLQM